MIKESATDASSDWIEKQRMVSEGLKNKYLTGQVNISHYLQKVQKERSKSVSIPTLDGLGVISSEQSKNIFRKYQFDINSSIDEHELKRMNNYLKESGSIEKLAFIRDAFFPTC